MSLFSFERAPKAVRKEVNGTTMQYVPALGKDKTITFSCNKGGVKATFVYYLGVALAGDSQFSTFEHRTTSIEHSDSIDGTPDSHRSQRDRNQENRIRLVDEMRIAVEKELVPLYERFKYSA